VHVIDSDVVNAMASMDG